MSDSDITWMEHALSLADRAAAEGEVPVGCVIVRDGVIVGEGWNRREALQDPIAHAEILAIREAAAKIGFWRLDDCVCHVTLEPCPMCAGALVNARVARLVYGAEDPKAGACGTLYDIVRDPRLNHRMDVTAGVLSEECGARLTDFFRHLRGQRSRS
ncbi:MAG: tRNA adenosine(34) deaminase TadA [Pseudomonadota bacterium]